MTTNYGESYEQPLPAPRREPAGKLSMWFGIATTPIFLTSYLILFAHGSGSIGEAIFKVLQFAAFVTLGPLGVVSLAMGVLAVRAKHQEKYAYVGMGLTCLSAVVSVGAFFLL